MARNQRRKSNKMDCSHRDEDTDDDDVESHQTDSEGQEEDDSEKSSGELEDEEEDNVTNTKLTSSKPTSNDSKKTITIPNDGSTKPSINGYGMLQLYVKEHYKLKLHKWIGCVLSWRDGKNVRNECYSHTNPYLSMGHLRVGEN